MSHHYSGPNFGFPHGDARLDLTDLYAFPKPSEAHKSILIMNVHLSAFVNPPGSNTREPFAPAHPLPGPGRGARYSPKFPLNRERPDRRGRVRSSDPSDHRAAGHGALQPE